MRHGPDLSLVWSLRSANRCYALPVVRQTRAATRDDVRLPAAVVADLGLPAAAWIVRLKRLPVSRDAETVGQVSDATLHLIGQRMGFAVAAELTETGAEAAWR